MIKRVFIALFAITSLARAQAPSTSATSQAHLLWKETVANVSAAADDVPESMYSYKPTPEVRSFGEIVAHVAGSQMMFCSLALGTKGGAEDDVEKTAKTKAAIVAALKASNTACEKAYKQTDA